MKHLPELLALTTSTALCVTAVVLAEPPTVVAPWCPTVEPSRLARYARPMSAVTCSTRSASATSATSIGRSFGADDSECTPRA